MEHAPYSPDHTLSDLWLFVYIKKRLSAKPDAASLFDQISQIVYSKPAEFRNTSNFGLKRSFV